MHLIIGAYTIPSLNSNERLVTALSCSRGIHLRKLQDPEVKPRLVEVSNHSAKVGIFVKILKHILLFNCRKFTYLHEIGGRKSNQIGAYSKCTHTTHYSFEIKKESISLISIRDKSKKYIASSTLIRFQ